MKTENGIEYEIQEGEETPVVFIHGWLGSKDFWKLITPYLDLENPKIFYNQRCHQSSTASDFSMDDLANDLKDLIEELELEEPILVGHSLGGMTALKYATEHENFSGLCLLGTSASTPEPKNKSVEYFLEKFDELDREEWADRITENYAGDVDTSEIKEMTRTELTKANEEPVKAGLKAMINYDIRDELENIEKPAMIIAAQKDGAITMEKSRELANLLNCRIKKVNTSHQMLPEEPERIARIISRFVCEELK